MEEFTAILHRRAFTVSESNKVSHGQNVRGRGRRELEVRNQYCTATDVLLVLLLIYGNRADHYLRAWKSILPEANQSQAVSR